MFRHLLLCLTMVASRTIIPPPNPPLGWHASKTTPSQSEQVDFKLCLTETNQKKLETIALQVSTPTHANYGQFLTATEIDALTAPAPKTLHNVLAWLTQYNIVPSTIVRQRTLHIHTTVQQVEQLFNTTIERWEHPSHTSTLLRARAYSIPTHLEANIMSVFGLHGVPFPAPAPAKTSKTSTTPKTPTNTVQLIKSHEKLTPSILQAMYHLPPTTAATVDAARTSSVKQAVVEFGSQSAGEYDVVNFFSKFVPATAYKKGIDDAFVAPNGGAGGRPTDEAGLDIQYIMATAPGAATEYWYYKTNDLCSSFKDFLEDVLAKSSNTTVSIPSVFSISYGIQGNVTGLGCDPSQIAATDADFAKVAALGITMIVASGDSGAKVDVGDCWGGPLRNNTSLQGTTSAEHQLIDSYLTCCGLAGSSPWTFVGPGKQVWRRMRFCMRCLTPLF